MRKCKFLILATVLVVMPNTMTYADSDIALSIIDDSLDLDNIRYEVSLDTHNLSLNEQVIIALDEGLGTENVYVTDLINGRLKRYIDFNVEGSEPSLITLVIGNKVYLQATDFHDVIGNEISISPITFTQYDGKVNQQSGNSEQQTNIPTSANIG